MSKSIITEYNYCMICGSPNVEIHHALFGTSSRKKADEDGLLMPMCAKHHNSCADSVHMHYGMKVLSRQLAQAIWEREYAYKELGSWVREEARNEFMKRYGTNYL